MSLIPLARRLVFVGLILAVHSISSLPAAGQEKPVGFSDLMGVKPLEESECQAMAQYVADRLHGKQSPAALPAELRADKSPRVCFISVSDGVRPAQVVMAGGSGAIPAADQAVGRIIALFPEPADRRWAKVDFVQQVNPLQPHNLRLPIDPSLEGLALEGGVALLPEELTARKLVEARTLQYEPLRAYLENQTRRNPRGANLEPRALFRFTAASYFLEDDGVVKLYRGHRGFENVSKENLLIAAIAGGEYLKAAVGADGRFDYLYLAGEDRVSAQYNIVRHAGTIWAMLDLYDSTRDEELLKAAERAIDYLVKQIKPMRMGKAHVVGVVEDDAIDLGGNALAALALAKQIELTGDRQHLSTLLDLGRAMLAAQAASGRFVIQKQRFSTGAIFDLDSEYFPGEAMLAMLRIYALDPDPAWLDASEKAAEYLITIRDYKVPDDKLPHDHWMLYALNDLHRHRPKPIYLEHAMKIAHAIARAQRSGGGTLAPDTVGSWNDSRSAPAATRSEALLSAYHLARDFGRPADAEVFLRAIRLGIAFQLQLQIRPESAMYFKNPPRPLGGFRGDLSDDALQIDVVQHNIASFLALSRLLPN